MNESSLPFLTSVRPKTVKSGRFEVERHIAAGASKVIDVQVSALSQQLNQSLSKLNHALSSVDMSTGAFSLDEVSLTLSLTADGRLVVLSCLEAGASPQVGVYVTLRRRRTDDGRQ